MRLPHIPELLQYPIGQFIAPAEMSSEEIQACIKEIRVFPERIYELTTEMTVDMYSWAYRPQGWSIRQLIHHCADSHMNAFLRLKWALFEDKPIIKPYDEGKWATSADVVKSEPILSLQLLDGLHHRWADLLDQLDEGDLQKGYIHPDQGQFVSIETYVANYAWHCKHHYKHMQLALDHEGKYTSSI